MARAEEVVSMEQSNLHWRVKQEDLLLFVGSIYDDQIKRTDAPLGTDDMLQDLLVHIEASFMHSNITPAQKRSTNETQQEPTRPAKKHAQQPLLSSAVEFTSFSMEERLSNSRRLQGKAPMTTLNDSHLNRQMKAYTEAEIGWDPKNGEDADNWSMVAERSQGGD